MIQSATPISGVLSGDLEPKTRSFLQSLADQGGPPIYQLSVEDARQVLRAAQGGKVSDCPPGSTT